MRTDDAVRQFIAGYFSTVEHSPRTRRAYASDLAQFLGSVTADHTLEQLTPEVVETWASSLRELQYRPASIRRKLASLRSLCNYWLRRNEITSSPFWRVRLKIGHSPSLPRILTVVECSRLLAEAGRQDADASTGDSPSVIDESFIRQRNAAIVALLFATGIRVGELAAIQLGDISPTEPAILIHGKGRRERLCFLVDGAGAPTITRYFARRQSLRAESRALFLSSRGRPLAPQDAARALCSLARAAGIERRVTPHMIRHTVATLLLRNGADIRVIQEFLGHSSISMTQRYTHVSKEHLVATLRSHHPVPGLLAALPDSA